MNKQQTTNKETERAYDPVQKKLDQANADLRHIDIQQLFQLAQKSREKAVEKPAIA